MQEKYAMFVHNLNLKPYVSFTYILQKNVVQNKKKILKIKLNNLILK